MNCSFHANNYNSRGNDHIEVNNFGALGIVIVLKLLLFKII